MNRSAAVAAFLLGISGVRASLDPAMWDKVALTNAGTNNQWVFWPDAARNPRVVAKGMANGAVNHRVLTGGPPVWAASPAMAVGLNKEGFFVPVPNAPDRGYLIGPHLAVGTFRLKMLEFSANGVTDSLVDPVFSSGGFGGISAALDPQGNLHIAYVWSPGANEVLCYGRRNSNGVWQIDEQIFNRNQANQDTGARIGATAVVPSGYDSANIYFTLFSPLSGNATALMQANLLVSQGIPHIANPIPRVPNNVKNTLRGTRVNSADRVFFFEGTTLKRLGSTGTASQVQPSVTGAKPRSIHVATSPKDNRQRVAWYDGSTRKIHYLQAISETTFTPHNLVTLTNNGSGLADADLQGLHFDSDGLPYLLYRRLLGEGYVAYPDIPDETLDNNGNGRIDLLDTAFGSNTAGPRAMPVPDTANSFQIAFPTIGTATANPTGGLQTASANLKYTVELSPDLVTWTPVTSTTDISYAFTPATGANRTATATITGPAGAFTARFARVAVTRLNPPAYPY